MSKFALIDTASGQVKQWQDHEQFGYADPAQGEQLVPLADDFAFPETPRWYIDGQLTDVSPLPAVDPRAAAIGARWEQIKAERDRRSQTGGFECNGKWFHSDAISRTQHLGNKDTARDQLDAGGMAADPLLDPVSGQQISWKTMDGTFVPLTVQLALDIVRAGKGAEFATFAAAETHRAAMQASADPAAYNYSAGWPPVYQPVQP